MKTAVPGAPGVGSRAAMIPPAEALRLVIDAATPRAPRAVPIRDSCGRTLAEPVSADRDLPPFRRVMMDGFAVRVASRGRTVPVVGEVAAGAEGTAHVTEEGCIEVLTGAPCPPGTEAVVQKEQVRREGDRVLLPDLIEPGQHIAPAGSECRRGRVVLSAGQTATALGVAAMASFGVESVLVVPAPRTAVITTGSELAEPGRVPGPAQIRDSNGPMLEALVRGMGLEPPSRLHAGDGLAAIARAIEEVSDRDIIVLAGGVSAGKYDLVPPAVEAQGAVIVFHGVAQKPGKPLLLARRGAQLIFGLPGNPLACHLCFSRYVAAAILVMDGRAAPTAIVGELLEPVRPKGGRTHFVPACARHVSGAGSPWQLRPVPGVSSADVFASVAANSYIEVPPGNVDVPAGESLRFWLMPAAGGGEASFLEGGAR